MTDEIVWPDAPVLSADLIKEIKKTQTKIENSEDSPELFGSQPYLGEGRMVYDVSEYTDNPFVVKIPFNHYGRNELRVETECRERVDVRVRQHLAPVYQTYSCNWGTQPKCDSLPYSERHKAEHRLRKVFDSDEFDQREICTQNIGIWKNEYVLYDYGGVLLTK